MRRRTGSFGRREWKAVGLRMGELYENYLHMTEYVHQRLAESKLLNSYLWAKGIR